VAIAAKLVEGFTAHLRRIDCTRKKAEELHKEGRFVRRDVELVYSGLFLEAVTSFESFLERLFIGLVCESVSHPCLKVRTKAKFASPVVCHEVLRGGRSYVEWMPYEYTEKRSEAYLIQGLPFTGLDSAALLKLKKISLIRNALAHKSRHALEKFALKVVSGANLLPQEKSPAGYLRTIFAASPQQNRYEECICDLAMISRILISSNQCRR
jgi:hypothetical protein